MKNPFVPGVGGILSADIAVPEHERELAFYAQILTTGNDPLWAEDLTNNKGMPIIGLGKRIPEYEALPLQWMPHFQVADIAASAASALNLGGTEIMHGKDEQGQSQWAVMADPDGAAFGLISAVDEASAPGGQPESMGHIAWLSLESPDVSSACAFYEQVIGWSAAPGDSEGIFLMHRPDGGASAAIGPPQGDQQSTSPVWILYLPVDDLKESLRRVAENGGEVIQGSAESGYAVIRDPVGVCFGLKANTR